jgi:rare lipoprotein A
MRFSPAPVVGILGLALMTHVTGCASRGSGPRPQLALYEPKPLSVEYGKASFYGGRWIGRLTANGEHYRAGDKTAAHKKLPFNTMVRVTNLANNRTVIVRINNRGPYAKGRILDLSVAAARDLNMTGDGIVRVKAEVLKPIEILDKPNRELTLR